MVHVINAAGDKASVSLFGGQVLSWVPADGAERLYCSPQATNTDGRAVRGGIPVCFPQFANRGKLAKHGFARTSHWRLSAALQTCCQSEVASVQLTLQDSELSWQVWPCQFDLLLHVSLGPGWLEVTLKVCNPGTVAFDFTAALHTYLAVADVRNAAVVGLKHATYIDSTQAVGHDSDGAALSQNDAQLRITGELDRIYLGAPAMVDLVNSASRNLNIVQTGFGDTVVWNPGPIKAAALGDMPAADWTRMLCIEAAQVVQPVLLQPGCNWLGSQRLLIPKQ